MNWTVLFVNLTDLDISEAVERLKAFSDKVTLAVTSSLEEAKVIVETGSVLGLVVVSDAPSKEIDDVLLTFSQNVSCFPDALLIVCNDPSPKMMMSAFEYGLDEFCSRDDFERASLAIIQTVVRGLVDSKSPEFKIYSVIRAIRLGDQEKIKEALLSIREDAKYDHILAFVYGRGLEAIGQYNEALASFTHAKKLNTSFRPAYSSSGELLLLTGQIDEAIEIFKGQEKSNKGNVRRKVLLASAFLEKQDLESAEQYLENAEKIDSNSSKFAEAKAHYYLCQGKIKEAMQLMEHMDNVGPYFASKLNDIGVKLSQSGRGSAALALYNKAHKVVRPELRYKISLNACLACRRTKEFKKSLQYLARCRKEFGGTFDKLDKIEQNLHQLIQQQKTSQVG